MVAVLVVVAEDDGGGGEGKSVLWLVEETTSMVQLPAIIPSPLLFITTMTTVIKRGWLDKKARDMAIAGELFQRRYVVLTPEHFMYFHDEPSEDLEFVKGTEAPIARHSIEIERIEKIEVIGEKKRKLKLAIRDADVKGQHSGTWQEYLFRCSDYAECQVWIRAIEAAMSK